jgi:hypothetical protein
LRRRTGDGADCACEHQSGGEQDPRWRILLDLLVHFTFLQFLNVVARLKTVRGWDKAVLEPF